jgi:large subunit ribosomal protein L21
MTAYAIVDLGGRQERVATGEKCRIDLIDTAKKGDTLTFDKVLFLGGDNPVVGAPYVPNAKVKALVTDMGKDGEGLQGPKIDVFKMKRRKGFRKTIGHRQRYTEIEIKAIEA